MSEESTTPDLVERMRKLAEAANGQDSDTVDSYYAPDAVWDSSRTGVGSFEGAETIRRFFEDWRGSYEEWEIGFDELLDIGNGVVFTIVRQAGRPVGTTGYVRHHPGTESQTGLVAEPPESPRPARRLKPPFDYRCATA